MAKYPFMVKHNNKLYQAGEDVPVGKEVAIDVDTDINDMSANEIREELKTLGIPKSSFTKKVDLVNQLIEARAAAEAKDNNDQEDVIQDTEEVIEDEVEDIEDGSVIDSILNEK